MTTLVQRRRRRRRIRRRKYGLSNDRDQNASALVHALLAEDLLLNKLGDSETDHTDNNQSDSVTDLNRRECGDDANNTVCASVVNSRAIMSLVIIWVIVHSLYPGLSFIGFSQHINVYSMNSMYIVGIASMLESILVSFYPIRSSFLQFSHTSFITFYHHSICANPFNIHTCW